MQVLLSNNHRQDHHVFTLLSRVVCELMGADKTNHAELKVACHVSIFNHKKSGRGARPTRKCGLQANRQGGFVR
jgi:hypothetical protein